MDEDFHSKEIDEMHFLMKYENFFYPNLEQLIEKMPIRVNLKQRMKQNVYTPTSLSFFHSTNG